MKGAVPPLRICHRAGAQPPIIDLESLCVVQRYAEAALAAPAYSIQVQGNERVGGVDRGGGNSGATYRNDFIEIFNAGDAPVNLAGYSVQYASAAGTSWQVTPLTGFHLAPGQSYLVQQAAGTGGATALPMPDATGTINMSGSAGQVLLAEATGPASGKADARVRGHVASSGLTNTTSFSRLNGGGTDTDANTDFSAGTVSPRNTAMPPRPM